MSYHRYTHVHTFKYTHASYIWMCPYRDQNKSFEWSWTRVLSQLWAMMTLGRRLILGILDVTTNFKSKRSHSVVFCKVPELHTDSELWLQDYILWDVCRLKEVDRNIFVVTKMCKRLRNKPSFNIFISMWTIIQIHLQSINKSSFYEFVTVIGLTSTFLFVCYYLIFESVHERSEASLPRIP